MIKVKNGIASREPVPSFLSADAAGLLDLSWTDPALGLRTSAWWPEDDQSPKLGQYERYSDAETLTLDLARKVVVSKRMVFPWSSAEIAAHQKSLVPKKVTRRQARQALLLAGKLDVVSAAIAALDDGTLEGLQRSRMAEIEWVDSLEFERERPLLIQIGKAIGLDDAGLDELFIKAAKL